ncbi:Pentatricopeptide repeat [Dillenia turbinata]|uniref:Pentatricopeptide repeat n=1 Tax=Dillenia turbinata TaxID=194707 RepID=A0AAN8ZP13_9MAGN
MLRNGVEPSNFTYPFVLKACSILGLIQVGEQVHTHVYKLGFRSDVYVNNSLVHMYCKSCCLGYAQNVWDEMLIRDEVSWNSIISGYVQCGELERARHLFEEMPIRQQNVVCWTALINGYGKEGNLGEMLRLFRKMVVSGEDIEPNSATMVCLLSSCSSLSNFEVGRWVSVFVEINAIPVNAILCTALIDLYAKCGNVDKAQQLFDKFSCKNLASWNALMTGYVHGGCLEEVVNLYRRMQVELVKPDEITMVNVLSACAGLGALELGREVHLYLGRNCLEQNVVVATALVEMYSKCGNLDDACLVFVKTRHKDLAFACRIHKNLELANKVGEIIMTLPNLNLGFCILLSNIYASAGRWRDVAKVRRFVKSQRIKKPSGCSWIEVEGVVHRFVVEDKSHLPQEKYSIHLNLIDHLKDEGYVPILDVFQNNIDGM